MKLPGVPAKDETVTLVYCRDAAYLPLIVCFAASSKVSGLEPPVNRLTNVRLSP